MLPSAPPCHDCGAPAAPKAHDQGFYRRCWRHLHTNRLKRKSSRRSSEPRAQPVQGGPLRQVQVSLCQTQSVQREQTLTQTQTETHTNRISRVRQLPDGSVQTEEHQFTVCLSQQLAERITVSVRQKYAESLTQRLKSAMLPQALENYRDRIRHCVFDLMALNLKEAWELLSRRMQIECENEREEAQTRLNELRAHIRSTPCPLPSAEEYQVLKRLRQQNTPARSFEWVNRAKQALAVWYLEPCLARGLPATLTLRCNGIAEDYRSLPFGYTQQQPQPPPDYEPQVSIFVGLCQASDDSITLSDIPLDLALLQGRPETALTDDLVDRWQKPLLEAPPSHLFPLGFSEAQAINGDLQKLQPRPQLCLTDVLDLNAVAERAWMVRCKYLELKDRFQSLPLTMQDLVDVKEWKRLEGYVQIYEPLWTLKDVDTSEAQVEELVE